MLKVLVACEESQRVCTEFRKLGHEAYSCDLIDPSGDHPEWHIKTDALSVLQRERERVCFITMDGEEHVIDRWDLIIAHPPCTYLTVAANKHYNVEKYGQKAIERIQKRKEAIEFVMAFANADCEHIAIENPIGVLSSVWRKPDQIIHPFMFGDRARKATCLWLKGLPNLKPTDVVDEGEIYGKGFSVGAHLEGRDENGKWFRYGDPELAKLRSKTFPGIAKAIAEQWSEYVEGLK